MAKQVGQIEKIDGRQVTLAVVHVEDGEEARRMRVKLPAAAECLDSAVALLGREVEAEVRGGKFVSFKDVKK